MIDKTFSPPSEEVRTKLLARSGQCERLVREGIAARLPASAELSGGPWNESERLRHGSS